MLNDIPFTEEMARKRILVLTNHGEEGLTCRNSDAFIKALLYLDMQSHDDIIIVCQSQGGSHNAAIAICDMMQAVHSDVRTISVGLVQSAGSMISCAGTKGKRHCLPHARFVLHDNHKFMEGRYSWVKGKMTANKIVHGHGCRLYAKHCGHSEEDVERLLMSRKDNHMTAQEALEWGLVDSIVEKWGEWNDSDQTDEIDF